MPVDSSFLTLKRILVFWIPLAAVWLMMGIEPPVIAAGVARLPDPKLNLAAFGVSFAIVLLFESPVIQLLAAATALADGRLAYKRLLLFTHLLSLGLTALHLIVVLTPLYAIVVGGLMGVAAPIVEESRRGFLILTPWAAAIAYRRLWQGVLIRHDRSAAVPITMAVRLVFALGIVAMGLLAPAVPGARLGALALSAGVVSSAVCAYLMARPIILGRVLAIPGTPLPWPRFLRFYVPLALTTILLLAMRPIVTAGIARAPDALNSLALFPVLTGFLFLFSSLSISYQEVIIALLKSERDARMLTRFATIAAVAIGAVYTTVALTPLADLWFGGLADLPTDLLARTRVPSILLAPMPVAVVFVSLYRGVLISEQRTGIVTQAMGINFSIVVFGSLVATPLLRFPGVVTAATAMSAASVAEALYLRFRVGRHRVKSAATGIDSQTTYRR